MTEIEPTAWLYTRDDGSKDLVLDCNGEYARALLELGAVETPLFARTRTAPSGDVIALFESALNLIAGSHYERFGIDPTDIEEIPDMSAEDAMNLARDTLMAGPSEYQAAIAAMRPVDAEGGWIIGNGAGDKWRAWQDGFSCWVDDLSEATRYYRREDAEAVHMHDEDAWRVVTYTTALRQAGEV